MDRYEIRIIGHLDQRHAHVLGCNELVIRPPSTGADPLRDAGPAALDVNVAVLWLHWPPQATFGR